MTEKQRDLIYVHFPNNFQVPVKKLSGLSFYYTLYLTVFKTSNNNCTT